MGVFFAGVLVIPYYIAHRSERGTRLRALAKLVGVFALVMVTTLCAMLLGALLP